MFFRRLLIVIVEGVFIYAFLGQAERLEKNIDGSGGSRPKRVWVVRLGQGPTSPVLVWPLGLVSLTSSPPGASHGKILTPKKSHVNLSAGKRSLKRKNTQNMVFLFCRVITKIRGVDGKSP
jgi:hypothetical protein